MYQHKSSMVPVQTLIWLEKIAVQYYNIIDELYWITLNGKLLGQADWFAPVDKCEIQDRELNA